MRFCVNEWLIELVCMKNNVSFWGLKGSKGNTENRPPKKAVVSIKKEIYIIIKSPKREYKSINFVRIRTKYEYDPWVTLFRDDKSMCHIPL